MNKLLQIIAITSFGLLGVYMGINNDEPVLFLIPIALILALIITNLKKKGKVSGKLVKNISRYVFIIPALIILVGSGILYIVGGGENLVTTIVHKIGELMIAIPFMLIILGIKASEVSSMSSLRYMTLLGGLLNLAVFIVDFDPNNIRFITAWLFFLFIVSGIVFVKYEKVYDYIYREVYKEY
jgi:lipid-A-disaccharide synthase-like uncharacterized protein